MEFMHRGKSKCANEVGSRSGLEVIASSKSLVSKKELILLDKKTKTFGIFGETIIIKIFISSEIQEFNLGEFYSFVL